MDSIKKSQYTQDLLANGTVKFRFEEIDEQRLLTQSREMLDEKRKNRSWNEKQHDNKGEGTKLVRKQ